MYTAHNAFEVSFMHMFVSAATVCPSRFATRSDANRCCQQYRAAFADRMNATNSRSMSFSHETSGATVNESRCYGSAIGRTLEQVLTAGPESSAASPPCTATQDTCVNPPPPPTPVPHHEAFHVIGAGSADCNGRYSYRSAPNGWPDHAPFYQKDELHSLYRYHGRWYICHTGVACYYDAPAVSRPLPEPPLVGWANDGNRTGALPAPKLQAVGSRMLPAKLDDHILGSLDGPRLKSDDGLRVVVDNAQPRRDTDGNILNSHDGSIVEHNGSFYKYGTQQPDCVGSSLCKADPNHCGWGDNNFTIHSSPDLTTWTLRSSNALPDRRGTTSMFLPKVIFNRKTQLFVRSHTQVMFVVVVKPQGWSCVYR